MPKENFKLYDRISSAVLSSTVLLSLIAFIPGGLLSGSTLKGYILIVGVSLAAVLWIAARFMEGKLPLARTWILPALGTLLIVFFFSALFSPAPYLSFFGEGLDQGAFVPMAVLMLSLFLASVLFSTKRSVRLFLSSAFVLYIILALYQALHLFYPALTSFGIFSAKVATPLGTWADFAYLSGAALVGAVLTLHFEKPTLRVRAVAIGGGILALFFLVLTNIFLAWVLTGIAMLGILAYAILFSTRDEGTRPAFPFLPFIVAIVSIFFFITHSTLGYKLADVLKAQYLGAAPGVSATIQTTIGSLRAHPVLGAGLNRFSHEWFAHRPLGAIMNTFWDTQFSSGSSLLLTEGMLAGVLGILALLGFLFSYVLEARKAILRKSTSLEDSRQHAEIFSIFILSLYFLLAILLAALGISITILAFFFIGLFVAVLSRTGRLHVWHITLTGHRRKNIASVAIALICITLLVFIFCGATKRVRAELYFAEAVSAANAGDPATADTYLIHAIGIVDLPSFERTRVSVNEQLLQKLAAGTTMNGELSTDAKGQAMEAVQIANTAGQKAIALDPSDMQNYFLYGNLMKVLAPFKVPKAFENARDAYLEAIRIDPDYPRSYLALAQLYADKGDVPNAENYANLAIAKKPNYTDAYFLLERVMYSSGDIQAAKTVLENARAHEPKNPSIYAEMGYLDYRIGDYEGAVSVLRTATSLGANNANSWYYLAEALAKTGDKQAAAMILASLHARLPDDKNIAKALSDLSTK